MRLKREDDVREVGARSWSRWSSARSNKPLYNSRMEREYWEYQWILLVDAARAYRKHFSNRKSLLELLGVALFSGLATWFITVIQTGRAVKEPWAIAGGAIVGPLLYLLAIFIAEWGFAPYRLYKKYREVYESLHTDNITYRVCPFNASGLFGYGIRIENQKPVQVSLKAVIESEKIGRAEVEDHKNKKLGFVLDKSTDICYDPEVRLNPKKKNLVFCVFGTDTGTHKTILVTGDEVDLASREGSILNSSYIVKVRFEISMPSEHENTFALYKRLLLYREGEETKMKMVE